MSPDQFLARMRKGAVALAYLFLGTEAWGRAMPCPVDRLERCSRPRQGMALLHQEEH